MADGEPKPGEFLVCLSWIETVPASSGQTRDLAHGAEHYFETFEEALRFRASSLGATGWVPTGCHSPDVSWVQRSGRRSVMQVSGHVPGELPRLENRRRLGALAALQRRHAQAGTTQVEDPAAFGLELDAVVARWAAERRDGSGEPATADSELAECRAGLSWRREGPSPVGVARQVPLRSVPSSDEPF